jgi:hypothetical protein
MEFKTSSLLISDSSSVQSWDRFPISNAILIIYFYVVSLLCWTNKAFSYLVRQARDRDTLTAWERRTEAPAVSAAAADAISGGTRDSIDPRPAFIPLTDFVIFYSWIYFLLSSFFFRPEPTGNFLRVWSFLHFGREYSWYAILRIRIQTLTSMQIGDLSFFLASLKSFQAIFYYIRYISLQYFTITE